MVKLNLVDQSLLGALIGYEPRTKACHEATKDVNSVLRAFQLL